MSSSTTDLNTDPKTINFSGKPTHFFVCQATGPTQAPGKTPNKFNRKRKLFANWKHENRRKKKEQTMWRLVIKTEYFGFLQMTNKCVQPTTDHFFSLNGNYCINDKFWSCMLQWSNVLVCKRNSTVNQGPQSRWRKYFPWCPLFIYLFFKTLRNH